MVEVSKSLLATMMVFTAYGGFRIGMDISDLICKKKWYWILLIISVLVTGYIIFLKGYGKWFVLVD